MANLITQAIGTISDNYADVIEGSNGWRGSGTAYKGIPGTKTNDRVFKSSSSNSFTASAAGDTTTIAYNSGNWDKTRFELNLTPKWYLHCTSSNTAAAVDQHRRITSWDNTAKEFTCDAFANAPGDGAVFTLLQGFRRIPNGIDIEVEGTDSAGGFDRFFDIHILPVQKMDFYGSGVETWRAELTLRLRILKFGRAHDAKASAIENLTIISSAMTLGANPDHRDGTYTRALLHPESPPTTTEDGEKVVAELTFPLIFRINRTFK